jgi:hypothetical protein
MDRAGIHYVKADVRSNPKAGKTLGDVSRAGSGSGAPMVITPTTVVGTSLIRGGDLAAIRAAIRDQPRSK